MDTFGQQRLGKKVIDLEEVSVFIKQKPYCGTYVRLAPDERLGIVGPNSSGKSTFEFNCRFRDSEQGTVEYGSTVSVGYFDQMGESLDQNSPLKK